MQGRNRERENTASKDNEENSDLGHGLLNDCNELANTLVYPQLEQHVQEDCQDRETQYLSAAMNIFPINYNQLTNAGNQGKSECQNVQNVVP